MEAEASACGLGRVEWVRAVLRRQLFPERPLQRRDRGYLSRALQELRAIRQELARTRYEIATAADDEDDVAEPLSRLKALEDKLVAVATAVQQGFLGEDAYWQRLHEPIRASGKSRRKWTK